MVRPRDGGRPGYACFAYEPKMPKLNTANPEVQEYFARVGRYWIERFHVDGWRLDVANEVDKNFWRRFRAAVREADPDAVLIGEVWENARDWLKGDLFDSVMNYDFRKHCRDFFALEKTGADEFLWGMTDMQLRYPFQVTAGQLNLLDSHDVARFLGLCGGDYGRWQAAFLYLCMAPGVPGVFYGDEKKITGIREMEYRQGMPWEADHTDSERFVKEVLRIRRDWIAPEDEWRAVYGGRKDRLLVFERYGAHTVRVIIHMGEAPADAESFLHGGQILLLQGAVSHMLVKNGFAVLLMQ